MSEIKVEFRPLSEEEAALITAQTLVEGALVAEWWKRQAEQFTQKVVDSIRVSMVNHENTQQAIDRLLGSRTGGVFKSARRRVSVLIQTAVAAVSSKARIKTFENNDDMVKGVQQVSTLDNRTSTVCIAYSNKAWRLPDYRPIPPNTLPFNGGPPRHFNCRSTLIPVLKSFRELGFDVDDFPETTRSSMDGQVASDISFHDWLKKKPNAFQDELLGSGRARMWRDGAITLEQLVDQRGRPLTLNELKALSTR